MKWIQLSWYFAKLCIKLADFYYILYNLLGCSSTKRKQKIRTLILKEAFRLCTLLSIYISGPKVQRQYSMLNCFVSMILIKYVGRYDQSTERDKDRKKKWWRTNQQFYAHSFRGAKVVIDKMLYIFFAETEALPSSTQQQETKIHKEKNDKKEMEKIERKDDHRKNYIIKVMYVYFFMVS